MEGIRLYVGVDSTQYSNGIYKEGRTKELCVAIFSTDPESLVHKRCRKKRDHSILETFLKNRNSASMIVSPEDINEDTRPIIYSAEKLTSFYIENLLKKQIEEIQIHIDGPLYGTEKNHLKTIFHRHGKIIVEGYKKFLKTDKTKNHSTQPKIVLAADALSNYLFRKKGTQLFPDLDSREARTVKIPFGEILIEHLHLAV